MCRPVTSSSTIHHPCVYVSMSGGKSPCSFLRNNPMGHYTQKGGTCRAVQNRSPVDFREGRRASDGLVAQGLLSQVDNPLSSVAFNSQRLHEACKAKGVLELHLLQQEAAQLNSQYQSSVPVDEMNVRQLQHSQFHVAPVKGDYFNKNVCAITCDAYVGMMKSDLAKHELMKEQQQKPPLQQQLMQHRLLQQKRQILQVRIRFKGSQIETLNFPHRLKTNQGRIKN